MPLPLDMRCFSRWPDWELTCELMGGHEGSHVGRGPELPQGGQRIGYWGGRVAYVTFADRELVAKLLPQG